MTQEKHKFAVNKNIFNKLVLGEKNFHDLSIEVDLSKREIISFRIYMRPLQKDDIGEYYKLYSDAEVIKKYCNGNIRSKQEVDDLMSNYLNQDEPSYFSIFHKDTSSFIGTIFLTTRNQEPGEILLGFLIHKTYWGNNYAKEALYGLLYCLFPRARPQITTIVATTRDDNLPSKKILETFNFECARELRKFDQKRLLYKIAANEINEVHHKLIC